jgi:hypothetical protein
MSAQMRGLAEMGVEEAGMVGEMGVMEGVVVGGVG